MLDQEATRGKLPLGAARFSKLVLPHTLMQSHGGGQVYASMGNATWAWLGWPVIDSQELIEETHLKFDPEGSVNVLHVTNPSDWQVLSFSAIRGVEGIVLRRSGGTSVSLIKAFIRGGVQVGLAHLQVALAKWAAGGAHFANPTCQCAKPHLEPPRGMPGGSERQG